MKTSTEILREYISSNLPEYDRTIYEKQKSEYQGQLESKNVDIVKMPDGEEILISYTDISITGTDRPKPQIRVFMSQQKAIYEYARKRGMRYFLFTIFSKDISMAKNLTHCDPREFLVSIETRVENEESRRDLRSLYDYLDVKISQTGSLDYVRCTRECHSSGICQASFIRIWKNNTAVPQVLSEYLTYFDNRPYADSRDDGQKDESKLCYQSGIHLKFSHNRIVFGAPGTGKSHLLENNRKGMDIKGKQLWEGFGTNYERVTFHSNYSYAQFVGVYKPVSGQEGEGISYQFVPGPFMRIYVKAVKSIMEGKAQPYLLLIEEINRANTAAVFGDIFQLLDRKNGVSEYPVHIGNDIREYLSQALGLTEEELSEIRIPDNLYLWATMNSADQGVFPMDTAFKRRWDFCYIGINENAEETHPVIITLGNGHKVYWDSLRRKINEILSSDRCRVNEDKLLGPYFISGKVLDTDASGVLLDNESFLEVFKNKVLMYLFEDAAKMKVKEMFSGCGTGSRLIYSEICSKFDEIGEEIFEKGLDLSIKM